MAELFSTEISGDFTIVDNTNTSLNGVIFHNVPTVYNADEDIICIYSFTDDIEPEVGDVIGLFKVGWTSPCDYFSSVPAKAPINNERHFLRSTFGAHLIPNDSSDLYQFCYISKMRVVGASTPFTFELSDIIAIEDPTDPGLLVFKSRVSQLKDELRKLSDEKTYYASKYKILHDNFSKLKYEFDKLEKELQLERENIKRLKETETAISEEWEEETDDQPIVSEEYTESKNSDLKSPSEVMDLNESSNLISEAMNTGVWKSLYEIYEVATDINRSFDSQLAGRDSQMPYKEFVNYILEVFSLTKKKFKIKGSGKIDESEYCKCYFEQKASCCPNLCTEPQFQFMMTQPLYMCFSNFNHYIKNDSLHCDGSFDPTSLTDYVKCMAATINTGLIKSGNVLGKQKNEPNLDLVHTDTEYKDEFRASPMLEVNENNSKLRPDILSQMTEEREKINDELKLSREKIASLISRINVLELELVSKQSSNLIKPELLISEDDGQDLVPSSSQNTVSIESILECVHNEYITLKDKYCELSKKIAKTESLEAKCTALEEENGKLIEYFTQIRDQNKKIGNSNNQVCTELEALLLEKAKVEGKLINLQKESVGKVSLNLVLHQKHQE